MAFLKENYPDKEIIAKIESEMKVFDAACDILIKYASANDVDSAIVQFNDEYAPATSIVLETLKEAGRSG